MCRSAAAFGLGGGGVMFGSHVTGPGIQGHEFEEMLGNETQLRTQPYM